MSPRRRLDCQDHLSHQVHGDKLAAGLRECGPRCASAGVASLSASGGCLAERQAFGASCDQLQLGVAVAPSDGRVARYSVFERCRVPTGADRVVPARSAAGPRSAQFETAAQTPGISSDRGRASAAGTNRFVFLLSCVSSGAINSVKRATPIALRKACCAFTFSHFAGAPPRLPGDGVRASRESPSVVPIARSVLFSGAFYPAQL